MTAPGTLSRTVTLNGTHSATAGTAPEMNDVTAAGMVWLTKLDFLGIDLVGAQRLVEEDMRGGAGRGCDPLAFQILERLDALIGAHPELRGRHFDVVDQEHLALSARRKVRQHRAGRQHVEAAADQRLENLEAGVELAQFEIEALLVEDAAVHAGPDLAVDGDRMQIADADFGLGLRDGGRGSRKAAERDAGGCGQKLSSIHGVLLRWF